MFHERDQALQVQVRFLVSFFRFLKGWFYRVSANKPKRRVILKNGECYILDSIKQNAYYLLDIFTFLVQIKWYWTLLIFAVTLLLSWLAFAVLWWLVAYTHGDFEPQHLPPYQKQSNFTPCLHEVYDFMSCFMFSIETQHTVGYGIKAPTEECPEAIFVNVIQCTVGTILQGLMSGIIFAKMTLPKKRTRTLMFSKNAVIALRDGFHCLMFRVGDIRENRIIDTTVRVVFTQTVRTQEGELLRLHQTVLKAAIDGCEEDVHLLWPMMVTHRIDKNSPLYDISPAALVKNNFEIIAILEGTIESTAQSIQARSSYVPSEILWGYKFEELLKYNEYCGEYEVDYSKFHRTVPADVPECSAREADEYDPKKPLKRNVYSFVVEQGFLRQTSVTSYTLVDTSRNGCDGDKNNGEGVGFAVCGSSCESE